jgi:hypothetical protein
MVYTTAEGNCQKDINHHEQLTIVPEDAQFALVESEKTQKQQNVGQSHASKTPEVANYCDTKSSRRNRYRRKVNGKKMTKNFKTSQGWQSQYFDVEMEPHFGLEHIDATGFIIDTILKSTGISDADGIIKEIEGLTALFVAISKSSDMIGVMATIFLYVRDKFPTSTAKTICSYISSVIGYDTQSGLEQQEDEPKWLKFIRSLRSDWSACIGDGLFKIFSKVLGVLVIAGLTDVSNLTFSMAGYKMIEPDIKVINGKAIDIVTAICDIVVFFSERCYHSWKQGSFRPLFSSSPETAQLEVQYARLCNHWDLYRNGNLNKMTSVSEHDFLRELEEMATQLKSMMTSVGGIDKRLLEDKFRTITKIIGNFNLIKVNSGFKRAPFTLEYYGLSKVGKSTISEQISRYLFTSAGLSTEDGRKYTHVSGKKHWDGARSDMLELKLDDHANTKEKFVESSPCDVIIKCCNNVPYSPPMADLNEKGKVWIQPELVSLTTNVENLDARVYSNNPYSIQRRMHYVLEVEVKPEFRAKDGDATLGIDTNKVIEAHTVDGVYSPPLYHDVWEVTVKIAVPVPDEKASGVYKIVTHEGKELKKISMLEVCNFLCERFHKHREEQFKLESNQQVTITQTLCGVDGCKQIHGCCMKHIHAQLGMESLRGLYQGFVDQNGDNVATTMLRTARNFYQETDWVPLMPRCVLNTKCFKLMYEFINRRELIDMYKYETKKTIISMIAFLLLGAHLATDGFGTVVFTTVVITAHLVWQMMLIEVIRDQYYSQLRARHTLNDIQSYWQDTIIKGVFASAVALGAIYKVAQIVKKWRSLELQGSLEPATQIEIDQRDREQNVWTTMAKRDLPITPISARMNAEQLGNVVQKALVYGSIHTTNGNAMVNGLMLTSNVMLVPDHYFEEFGDTLRCTFRKKNPEASGGKFVAEISVAASFLLPDSDLRVCYIPTGGSFKNLIEFFPTAEMPPVPFRMFWRQKDGEVVEARGMTNPQKVRTTKLFEGGMYRNLTINTFNGLCGATLISETKGSTILGVHLGGTAGTPKGCYGSITQRDIANAFEQLRKIEGVVLSGGAGEFKPEVLGIQVLRPEPLHVKSALNYIPQDSQIEYFGSCPGRSVTKTNVKVTPISEHITDVCDVPNIYQGPKLNPDWYGWQTCLANLAVPAHPFPQKLLELAVIDYKEALIPIFSSSMWNKACPLTDHENLCGVPGKKFMDAIKLNTSVGFPLTGPKREFVTELPPTEEKPVNRVLDEVLMNEINRIEECYRRGERGYPIAKACKKDEILAKDKCRIFYGNALSLTWLVRKYFLPLLRVLQMNPLLSECAVGINSHGPEWNEFHTHVTKFGMDRLIGGDYGKYDQKLPSQLIFAALRVLIDFARVCNYSDEDIRIMEAMTGDIVFAYIAFNGDLIGLTEGAHISGNSLTVIINGICGSLNLRCYFFNEYPPDKDGNRKSFRDCVAAMTYGDDNIGSVKPGIDKFTIKGCSAFLAEYGQVYTMPDKESELLNFLPPEDFEFLKRKSVYHPRLGKYVGALLDKSIYKSLHCFMRDKTSTDTEEYACALNIDGALREWFNHGESKYEQQRQLMNEVANRANIRHMCTGLDVSYNERVVEWYDKYGDTC